MKISPLLFLLFSLFSLASSYSDLPMGSNSSTAKLQTRQPIYHTVFSGEDVKLRYSGRPTYHSRTCTLGFAVKKVRGQGQFAHGYLTLGGCVPNPPAKSGGGNPYDAIHGFQDLVIGKTYSNAASLKYDPAKGLDYAIIKITEPRVWGEHSMGIVNNDLNQPPIIKVIGRTIPAEGAKVCFSGSYSGVVCGKVVQHDVPAERVEPWPQGAPQMHYLQHTVVVRLDWPTRGLRYNHHFEDLGAPVFLPIHDPSGHIVEARAVGLVVSYRLDLFIDVNFPPVQPVAYFHYQPIGLILVNEPNMDLIISPQN